MGRITSRGLDPELEKEIRRRAKKTGRLLNRVILELLYQSAGDTKRKKGVNNTLVSNDGSTL